MDGWDTKFTYGYIIMATYILLCSLNGINTYYIIYVHLRYYSARESIYVLTI